MLICLVGVLLGLVSVKAADQGQKPVKEQTIYTEFIGPPSTLNETVLSTELIVRGRILGNAPMDKTHVGNRGTWIRTGHRVRVLEVLRAPAGVEPINEITVVQTGGDRDRGQHVERLTTHRFPLLHPGKEYVFFLERAENGAWGSAYGPDGVFERDGDQVRPLGVSKMAARQGDLTWTEFIQVVTNFGIQGKDR